MFSVGRANPRPEKTQRPLAGRRDKEPAATHQGIAMSDLDKQIGNGLGAAEKDMEYDPMGEETLRETTAQSLRG